MAKIPITQIPKLPMPDKFETITIKMLAVMDIRPDKPGTIIYVCEIYGTEQMYQLTFTEHMSRTLIDELWSKDIEIDKNLECIVGHIFDIKGIEADFTRTTKKGEKFKPKVYDIRLRGDLEKIEKYGSQEEIERVRRTTLEKNKNTIGKLSLDTVAKLFDF